VAAAGRASGTGAGPAGLVITAHAAVRAAGRAAAGPGGGSVTREQGQRLARAELSKLMYRHATSIFERIDHLIDDLLNGASGAMGRTGLIVLAALLAIAIVVVMSVIGPVARSRPRGRSPLLAAGRRLHRSDHRVGPGDRGRPRGTRHPPPPDRQDRR